MNSTPENPTAIVVRPPRLVQSLISGFNAVANHIYVILLPVALDLLLWFGPHVRIKTLMEPSLLNIINLMRQSTSADMLPMVNNVQSIWQLFLDQFNLVSATSTFPVGIPSLMAGELPMKTPVGTPAMLEIHSVGQMILGWLLLTLVGFIVGSAYFALIAQAASRQIARTGREDGCPEITNLPTLRLGTLGWETMQVIALVILVLMLLLIISIPTILVSLLLSLISPFLGQLVLLLVSFALIWFMVPLVFSPHGIFMCGQSAFNAILNSTRVVRFTLPGTGLFLLAAIVLNQGLGMLWSTPPATSWMALVGIFGHAFIITSLLAASFVYYNGGLAYFQSIRKMILKNT